MANFENALNEDITDLITTDTKLQSSVTTNTEAILKLSNAVVLSERLPEVHAQIPVNSFIHVRKSDISGTVV